MTPAMKDVTSVAPALLLSMPQLDDPNFHHTVVLLCQHSTDGAWGLVLNRPTGTPAVQAVRMEPPLVSESSLDLWIGGPVEPERGCILMGDDPDDDETVEVCKGLFISGSANLLRRLLEHPEAPARTRLLMGYAGWGPGQLDAELRESAWLISEVDVDLVFGVGPAEMWEAAIRRLGADPSSLHMSPGVH